MTMREPVYARCHASQVVVGASGYLGAELLRLLASHPTSRSCSRPVRLDCWARSSLRRRPGLRAAYPGTRADAGRYAAAPSGLDVVFLAAPSGASQELVPELIDHVGLLVGDPRRGLLRLKNPAAL